MMLQTYEHAWELSRKWWQFKNFLRHHGDTKIKDKCPFTWYLESHLQIPIYIYEDGSIGTLDGPVFDSHDCPEPFKTAIKACLENKCQTYGELSEIL